MYTVLTRRSLRASMMVAVRGPFSEGAVPKVGLLCSGSLPSVGRCSCCSGGELSWLEITTPEKRMQIRKKLTHLMAASATFKMNLFYQKIKPATFFAAAAEVGPPAVCTGSLLDHRYARIQMALLVFHALELLFLLHLEIAHLPLILVLNGELFRARDVTPSERFLPDLLSHLQLLAFQLLLALQLLKTGKGLWGSPSNPRPDQSRYHESEKNSSRFIHTVNPIMKFRFRQALYC